MTVDTAPVTDWKARAIETYREIEAEPHLSADLRQTCREHREALEAERVIRWGDDDEQPG